MTETMSVTDTLRKPFKPGEIGKLPRVTCRMCSRGNCADHERVWCDVCKSNISERHIHLDYVGHADVTSRLLDADPDWSWVPAERDVDPQLMAAALATGNPEMVRLVLENSPPKFDLDGNGDPVGLWIRLTVGGVTRPGHGSCPSGQNDAVKVLIGDALRNAAMRFGVAVDLWAKGDRSDPASENATASGGQARRGRQAPARESFENAKPAASRQPPSGNTVRPAQAPRPPAAADGEIDEDAQAIADEASVARTTEALKTLNTRAREEHRLACLIRNPATGGTGGLGQYIAWRKGILQKTERALDELMKAAATAGIDTTEAEHRLVAATGHNLEEATAEEIEKATALILEGAAAA